MCCYIVILNKLCISKNCQSQKGEVSNKSQNCFQFDSPENIYLYSKPSPPSQSGDSWGTASPSGSAVWGIFHQGFCNLYFSVSVKRISPILKSWARAEQAQQSVGFCLKILCSGFWHWELDLLLTWKGCQAI